MHLLSCHFKAEPRWGVAHGQQVYLAPTTPGWPSSLHALVRDHADPGATARECMTSGDGPLSLNELSLTAPIPQPDHNVMCLGLNYAAHAAESLQASGKDPQVPEYPVVFTKSTRSVAGPYDDIPLDSAVTSQLDWEVELAVVLGRTVHKADAATARDAIAGYTVVNDLSARDIQFRHKQFFLGKSLAKACPMGPYLVTADAVADPQSLDLACQVNGTTKQAGNTAEQVFGCVEIIRQLSGIMTLSPGDIIATGTPDGVGFARKPPEFLEPGDRVTSTVDGIGSLDNRIVAAATAD